MKAKEWSARLIEHLPVFIAGDGTANEAFAKDIAELNLECAESINTRIRAFDANNKHGSDLFDHYIHGLKEASEKWNAVCHRVNLAYQVQRDRDGEIYLLSRGAMAMHLLAFLRDAYAEEGGMLDTLSLSDASTFIAHTVQVMHNLPPQVGWDMNRPWIAGQMAILHQRATDGFIKVIRRAKTSYELNGALTSSRTLLSYLPTKHHLLISAEVTGQMVSLRDLESTMSEDERLEKNERDLELLLEQMRRR